MLLLFFARRNSLCFGQSFAYLQVKLNYNNKNYSTLYAQAVEGGLFLFFNCLKYILFLVHSNFIVLYSVPDIVTTYYVYYYCIFLSAGQWVDCRRRQGRVDDFSFFDCSSPFRLFKSGRRDFFFLSCSLYFFLFSPSLLNFFCLFVLFHSCCSHV